MTGGKADGMTIFLAIFPVRCRLPRIVLAMLAIVIWPAAVLPADEPPTPPPTAQPPATGTGTEAESKNAAAASTDPPKQESPLEGGAMAPETSAADASQSKPTAVLPQSFDTLRPIRFFQGQGSGVLPDSFRPITISQLDARLRAEGAGTVSVFEKPQLDRAVYVARLVDSALVSTETIWEISHGGDSPARLSLGKVGLALQSATVTAVGGAGFRSDTVSVVTEPDGTASVDVQGDTRMTLAWTAAGREAEREIQFDIAFPRSQQARWLIELPQGMGLQAVDGVGQSLPSPPPEVSARDSGRGTWYAIEAGGLDRLRFRVSKVAAGGGETEVIVRQGSFQYDLSSSVMRFSCRLTIDPPRDGQFPPLQISGGRVTSVTVGGNPVTWNETTSTGVRLVRIARDRGDPVSSAPITITVDGEAAWDTQSDLQPLPWLRLRDCVPIVIGNQLQTKVVVDWRLTLMRLQLPTGWRYLAPVENDGRRTTYRLGGPWQDSPPMVGTVNDQGQAFAESVLRLSATESRFRATWESSVSLASLGPQPIRLRVDAGWTVESVLLPLSGRVADLPTDFATRREIVIWPTADELIDGNLKIRVTGSRPFRIEGDWARYPATAFVTYPAGRNRFAAVITPPAGFRWDAEASLQNNRIGIETLSATQRSMVDSLPTDALLLDITQGRIMSLGSRRPSAAFNVSSLMTVGLTNDSVIEMHTIKCESASGELDQVRVEFAGGPRADLDWSVSEKATPGRRLIRAKRMANLVADSPTDDAAKPRNSGVSGNGEMPREIWDLELERSGGRTVVLIGRRETSLVDGRGPVRLELPSVLGANNRLAQVFVPDSLEVTSTGDGVLRVPRLVGPDLISGAAKPEPGAGVTLRYDSSTTNWIEVAPAAPGRRAVVLWHEAVDIVASGRGGDWITATYQVDVGSTLLIRHDAELRLASVTDGDGKPLLYESELGELAIPLADSGGTLAVRWSRPATSFEPARKWAPPRITPAAIVLRRDWRLCAAPDTWLPGSLADVIGFQPRDWFAELGRGKRPNSVASDSLATVSEQCLRIDPTPQATLWLIDRSLALSAIAVLGVVMFALAWMGARRRGVLVGACFAISVLLLPGFSTGWIYWVAAVCVPIATGGLIGSTLAATWREQMEADLSERHDNAGRSSARLRRGGSGNDLTPTVDAIAAQRYRMAPETERLIGWLLAILFPLAGGSVALGQSDDIQSTITAGNKPQKPPIVLVPTKPDGTLAGDKVYISQSFFNNLFREKSISVAPPLITSAVYRLRLDGMTETGMPTADWEIRYSLANLAERSEILLPFRSSQVRSVQWLPGGEAKPLRWLSDGEGQIRVSLPPTSSAAMLVRLATEVQSPDRLLRRVQLTIPVVTAASLIVDSGTAVQRFEITGAIGQTIPQPESGRMSADLGPSGSIDLTVALRQGARGIPAIAARRYWIHGSGNRCQIECEIDPGTELLRRGTDLPIVILGGQPAILSTKDWAIQSAEMISPQRQLLTCRALRDSAGPIRLLWNLETQVVGDEGNIEAGAFSIPDVISAGSAPTPDALIAIQSGDGYRLVPIGVPLDPVSQSPDTIDSFVSLWSGFRDTASQVIRSSSPLARFAIVAAKPSEWSSNERHHLHVRQGEMRVTLDAIVTRGAQAIGPLRFALPKRLEIRELTINGTAVSVSPHSIAGRSEVAIAEPIGSERFVLRVVAHQRLGTDETFSPPRIRIVPIGSVTGTYTLTRDQGLRVEQIRAVDLPELDAPALDIADQLLSGYFPSWTWQITDSPADLASSPEPAILLNGLFRAEQRASRVDTVQRNAIRWTQSRWMLDVLVQARARGPEGTAPSLLDDLSIELPTAWSDQLVVEPAEAWSSQPAIDPTMKVIRIRPDARARAAGIATIRLQAFRVGEADSLLEMPTVRVMGAASTQTFLSVPQTASGRPLIWQTESAIAEGLPAGLEADDAASAGELVFRALSDRATVRLQPSRPEVTVASASLCDIQLFPQPNRSSLAIIRWDVEPGDSKSIAIDVPAQAVPLALWAAGKTVPLDSSIIAKKLDVPMALSQLAQPITLLCRLNSVAAQSSPKLPRLVDVQVNQTWLTVYQPATDSTRPAAVALGLPASDDDSQSDPQLTPQSERENGWTTATDTDRLIALAQSVIDITEASISGATDRPQEELVTWLTDWDRRMMELRAQAVQSPGVQSLPFELNGLNLSGTLPVVDGPPLVADPTVVPAVIAKEPSEPWDSLVEQWREYVRRVTAVENLGSSNVSTPSMIPSAPWTIALVATHPGVAVTLPAFETTQEVTRLMLFINLVIAASLVFGCGLLTWLFRNSLAKPLSQPAVWLLAVGLASIAVTPIPVAIAICVVALTAPLLNTASSGDTTGKTLVNRSRSQSKPIART